MENNGQDACKLIQQDENQYRGNALDTRIAGKLVSNKLDERFEAYQMLANQPGSVSPSELSKYDSIFKETTSRGQTAVLKLLCRVRPAQSSRSASFDKILYTTCRVYACSTHAESRLHVADFMVGLGPGAHPILSTLIVDVVSDLQTDKKSRGLTCRQLVGILGLVTKCIPEESLYEKAIVSIGSLFSSSHVALSNLELKRSCYEFLRLTVPGSSVCDLRLGAAQEKELRSKTASPVFLECSDEDICFTTPLATAREFVSPAVLTLLESSDWKDRRSGFVQLQHEPIQLSVQIESALIQAIQSDMMPVYTEACKCVLLYKEHSSLMCRIFSMLVEKLSHCKMVSLIRVTKELILQIIPVITVRMISTDFVHLLNRQEHLWWLLKHIQVATQSVRLAVFEKLIVPSLKRRTDILPDEAIQTIKRFVAEAAVNASDLTALVALMSDLSERQKTTLTTQLGVSIVGEQKLLLRINPSTATVGAKLKRESSERHEKLIETTKLSSQLSSLLLNENIHEIMDPRNIMKYAPLFASPEMTVIRDVGCNWFVWALLLGHQGVLHSIEKVLLELNERELQIMVPILLEKHALMISTLMGKVGVIPMICMAIRETRKKSKCIELTTIVYNHVLACQESISLESKRQIAKTAMYILSSPLSAQSSGVHAAAKSLYDIVAQSNDIHC